MKFKEILDKVAERAGEREDRRLRSILARANMEAASGASMFNAHCVFTLSPSNYSAHMDDVKTEAVNRVVDKIFGLADA